MIEIIKYKNNSKFYQNLIFILSLVLILPTLVQAGSSCFLPGTLITMANGSQIPIENVKVGEKIVSYDKDMKTVITEVLETESPIRDDYYIITFENGKELKVTDEHPLYIKSGKYEGWGSIIPEATMDDAGMKTKKIKVEDYVLNIEKIWIKIIKIQYIKEKVQTYNLKNVDKTNTFFAEGFLAHNKGGSPPPPPPPPPPCATRSAGCYKVAPSGTTVATTSQNCQEIRNEGCIGVCQGFDRSQCTCSPGFMLAPETCTCTRQDCSNVVSDTKIETVKANPGEISPQDFAYFLPESKCIRSGGCDCRSVSENVLEETDPDKSSGACNCIAGTEYNARAGCCGDDLSDCGRISSGVLCSIDSNFESANWLASSTNLGDIRYVGCARAEYLSFGDNWVKCDGVFWRKTVGNSEYICSDKGRESIVECCGDGSCKSRVDGKRLSTGQSILQTSAQTVTQPTQSVTTAAPPPSDATAKSDALSSNLNVGLNEQTTLASQRSSADRLDDSSGRQIHFMYVLPSNGVDQSLDTNGKISTSVAAFQKWLREKTGGKELKLDTFQGSLDITFFRLGRTNEQIKSFGAYVRDQIESELSAAGFNDPNKIYAVYYGGGSTYACGGSPWPPVLPGKVVAMYLLGTPPNARPCNNNSFTTSVDSLGYWEVSMLHDIIHSFGVVASCAPHHTKAGHVSDSNQDLMYAGDLPWDIYNMKFDVGNDDYFNHGNVGCVDLAMSDYFVSTSGSITPITGSVIKNKITGNAVASGDSKTYYCAPDRKFVNDLDVPSTNINDNALISKMKSTCEKAGLKWTGTKCCSENDDKNEYYDDTEGTGGCWNKELVISIEPVGGTDNSVINYKGEFHGCAIDKTNFNRENDNLLALADSHTQEQLITNHDYCFNDPEKNYYCSYTEKWLPTDGTDKTHVSSAPIKNPKQIADCCAVDECWDGEKCVENQKAIPAGGRGQPLNGLRCIDGEWIQSELKNALDEGTQGYCSNNTQCLLNIFGINESSQCIESGQYVDDNYCENGNWSSRTKLLALKLLKLKSGDYTLFCDNRENALNNLQYLTISGDVVANVLTNLQTNNFCILKYGSNIIAATSINKNLEDVTLNNLNIFGVSECEENALIDDGQYHSCDKTSKVWFNNKLKSIIYSPITITVPSEEESQSFIINLIKNIIDSIKRLITSPPFDESYVKGIKKFDRLYMTQQGSKSIMGSIEGKIFKNAVIQYTGFDTDICKFLDQFNQANKQKNPNDASGISCKKEGNNYYVLAQGSQLSNLNPDSIWLDLTSKLRLK